MPPCTGHIYILSAIFHLFAFKFWKIFFIGFRLLRTENIKLTNMVTVSTYVN